MARDILAGTPVSPAVVCANEVAPAKAAVKSSTSAFIGFLPFGGVGDSGWGAYHSEQGFARLSHQKAVFVQSRWSAASMLYPPYGPKFDRIMELMRRWL
jgi:hypothetical protein